MGIRPDANLISDRLSNRAQDAKRDAERCPEGIGSSHGKAASTNRAHGGVVPESWLRTAAGSAREFPGESDPMCHARRHAKLGPEDEAGADSEVRPVDIPARSMSD